MCKRIAITGPESTGKSWLAMQLAQTYQSIWVAEFAREYLKTINHNYNLSDIETIAQMQMKQINLAALQSNSIVFADTEMLVCYIWADYVFGIVPQSVVELTQNQQFDLYLLCNIDLPWEPDPLREHPDARQKLFDAYESELFRRNWPYKIVSGINNERLQCAVNAIETIIYK